MPLMLPFSALLIWSSASKLGSPLSLASSLEELGLRAPIHSRILIVYAIAVVEGSVALALVSALGDAYKASLLSIVALALGMVGLWGIVGGAQRPCGCFGATSAAPIGRLTLLSAGFFAVGGALSMISEDVLPWTTALPVACVLALVVAFYVNRNYLRRVVDHLVMRGAPIAPPRLASRHQQDRST